MAWYAYCITEQQTLSNGTRSRRPFLLEGIQGVNGAAVLGYPSGEFSVVVSEYERNGSPLGDKHVLDRKSTRLNSSHSQISYAVFCLKKKKKKTQAKCYRDHTSSYDSCL